MTLELLQDVRWGVAYVKETVHTGTTIVTNMMTEDLMAARLLVLGAEKPPLSVPKMTGLTQIPCCLAECAICQEVGTGAASRINRCGHVYHTSCLSPWLVNNSTCPMCRATV